MSSSFATILSLKQLLVILSHLYKEQNATKSGVCEWQLYAVKLLPK